MSTPKLNIGLYVSNLVDVSVYSVCKGAAAAAEDINANLLKIKRKLLEMHNYYEQCLDHCSRFIDAGVSWILLKSKPDKEKFSTAK